MRKLILFSGGMDSSLLAAHAANDKEQPVLLFVDYGQPHHDRERRSAELVAGHLGLVIHDIELPLHGGMVKGRSPVVPGRNLALLAKAVNVAIAHKCDVVEIGCCAADAEMFPDCRARFIESFNKTLEWSGLSVCVEAPLLGASKAEIRAELRGRNLFHKTWSCYYPQPDGRGCGQCGACKARGTA